MSGRLGSGLLALMLVLGVATFAVTRELRAQPDVVNTVVVPSTLEPGRQASISFVLARPDDSADVLIIDQSGAPVRALQSGAVLEAGPQSLRWDGRADDGSAVPAGGYRLEVILGQQGREIQPPGTIEVVR